MGVLAVLAERLAMIAGGHDQRVRRGRSQRGDQPAGLAIRRRDFLVVAIQRRPRGGRIAVGGVGVEEVDPEEERTGEVRRAAFGVRRSGF